MAFKVLILTGLLAVLLSVYADDASILSQESDISPDGASFKWSYLADDGSSQEQFGKDGEVAGAASWLDPEGNLHDFRYVAGVDGYQPEGDDIPVAPEVPADIARALEWIARHPQPEE